MIENAAAGHETSDPQFTPKLNGTHHDKDDHLIADEHDGGQDSTHNVEDTPLDETKDAHEQENATLSIASSKKRKFAELSSRSRSTSRAASPPWKAFAADGPTQFTADGKRRSARTNAVPFELQPPSDKRQTRAAHETSILSKAQKGSDKHSMSKSAGNAIKHESKVRQTEKPTVHAAKSPAPRPQRAHAAKTPSTTDKRPPSRSTDAAIKEEDPVKVTSVTPEKRRPGRPSNASKTAQLEQANAVGETKLEDKTDATVQPPPRIRLRLSRLDIPPQHPDSIPKQSRFASLEEVLVHYDVAEKEQGRVEQDTGAVEGMERRIVERPKQSPEELAWREARTRVRILEAAEPGGILSEGKSTVYVPDIQKEPPAQYGHSSHLWAHGAYLRILLDREKNKHKDQAKKLAHACLAKWKEKQPQTAEDKQKEEDAFFRLIYKQTARDVQRKWELVNAEIQKQRLAQWEEDDALTRDRKMQQFLDEKTKMLDQRRLGMDVDASSMDFEQSADEDDLAGSGTPQSDGNGSSDGSEDDDDDNMSSSGSEEAEHDSLADADDDNLSPEALRAKYGGIEAPGLGSDAVMNDETDEPQSDDDEEVEEAGADHLMEGNEDVDMAGIALEEVDQALLDDDDETTDMSDDTDSSDADDESEDGDDEESDEEEGDEKDVGLLGFLGGRERKIVQEAAAEESVEDNAGDRQDLTLNDSDHVTLTAPEDDPGDASVAMSPQGNLLSVTSQEEDRSSQPTPMDDTTAEPTEADSTTTVEPEDTSKALLQQEVSYISGITTPVPSLLRGTLREYQHFGLDWLAKLYTNQTNGILADEMGLGKTIQTISLLGHLAEEHEIWGPHLIVVPTSVILNWEMEFKKFLPGFKVLSYYGSMEERAQKRKGWSNPDKYNVVITSYQLVLKDITSIRVPEWHYMILDEAHNIKNFQSMRYQAMIRLKTHARLLLTGTPLQNSIQELWSLLTFLTAGQDGQGMGDLDEFTQWFRRPVDEIFVDGKNRLGVEAQAVVDKLHHSLRPYILRRMKAQVEKQLPAKHEHTVFCRLSKRQRQLYDAFLSRSDVKEKLSSGNPISVSQALMALRKVCNHPDLFEERPILTSFTMRKPFSKTARSAVADFQIKDLLVRKRLLENDEKDRSRFLELNFNLIGRETSSRYHVKRMSQIGPSRVLQYALGSKAHLAVSDPTYDGSGIKDTLAYQTTSLENSRMEKLKRSSVLTELYINAMPVYGGDLVQRCTVFTSDRIRLPLTNRARSMRLNIPFDETHVLPAMVPSIEQRSSSLETTIQKFGFVTPHAVAHDLLPYMLSSQQQAVLRENFSTSDPDPYHESRLRLSIAFPDKRLLQYDCGKLQQLALLLRRLQTKGSRALIFTQMTSVLNILERFLNVHGYKYLRLDGSTKLESRQEMMEQFNRDTRIDVFILSSRSGGVGMNLTGADTVIFYDLDWNPQMDKQCQDRAHRIGQTRDVHIYKLVSEHTIEVNILKKSNQKRMLDEVVIQEGEFTTDYFNRTDSTEGMVEDVGDDDVAGAAVDRVFANRGDVSKVLEAAEETVDVEAARAQEKDLHLDDEDFGKAQAVLAGKAGGIAVAATAAAAGAAVAKGGLVSAQAAPSSGLASDAVDAGGEEELVGHVDEYMLRCMSWMLKDVPFRPPEDKSKRGRLDKNGRDRSHRPKR